MFPTFYFWESRALGVSPTKACPQAFQGQEARDDLVVEVTKKVGIQRKSTFLRTG
jgi:hypothetical protein